MYYVKFVSDCLTYSLLPKLYLGIGISGFINGYYYNLHFKHEIAGGIPNSQGLGSYYKW